MRLVISPITDEHARAFLSWRYEEPYALYNSDPGSFEEDLEEYLDPANGYFSILDERGELLGSCCLGQGGQVRGGVYEDPSALDVGIGLRPDLTGKGTGTRVLEAILAFAQERYAPTEFRATVAAFNERSLRVCEKAGFRRDRTFVRRDASGEQEFVQLSLGPYIPAPATALADSHDSGPPRQAG